MKHDWEYKKLGEVCEVINGLWTGKKPPFVKVGVIRNTNFTKFCTLDDSAIFYTDVEEKAYAKRKLQKGDIIIEKSGGSEKQPVGRPILFDLDGEYSFSNFTSTLRINDGTILPSFLHKVLVGLYFQGKTRPLQSKTTGIHNLDFNKFLRFQIPVPALAVQERIVAELDKVSEIIEKKKQQMKELDNLAQSIFYDMFGDPVENEKGWGTCLLEDLCDIGSSKRIFAEEYTETGIPFYRGKEISEKSKGYMTSVELYISPIRYNEIKCKYGVPKFGDILLTAVGTIGNIWVVDSDEPFYFKDGNVLWLQKKKEASSIYLKYLLENLIEVYKKSMANGCAYSALTIMNLRKMPTNIIPLPLQQAFAEKIEAIEKQKELINQSIKEAQLLFDSRMDYYFGE